MLTTENPAQLHRPFTSQSIVSFIVCSSYVPFISISIWQALVPQPHRIGRAKKHWGPGLKRNTAHRFIRLTKLSSLKGGGAWFATKNLPPANTNQILAPPSGTQQVPFVILN